MNRKIQLEITTPVKYFNLKDVEYVRAPGQDGLFGIMGGHAHALIALGVGEIKVTKENKTEYWATSGGVAEITGDAVQLLLESAEQSSMIDLERTQSALERAKSRLKDKGMDQGRAEAALLRALNRLKVSSR